MKPIDAGILVEWYRDTARDLPWRNAEVTAWQILISEVMLQQTPVARVTPIWTEWVRRWPVPSAMAAESPAEVLRAWGKLGYPRRALRLHECAGVLAKQHDDVVPSDVETLLGLPGVGAYTARAIACFAYGQRVPVVDTNVRRVVARAVHGRGDAGNPSTTRDLVDVDALLPVDQATAATFSAALMELGATVCVARKPNCAQCPLHQHAGPAACAWIKAGRPEPTVTRRAQKYEGTDRQARGRLLDVLRDATGPVERARLDLAWPKDPIQRSRALDSLLVDGLIDQTDDGLFTLAGAAG